MRRELYRRETLWLAVWIFFFFFEKSDSWSKINVAETFEYLPNKFVFEQRSLLVFVGKIG